MRKPKHDLETTQREETQALRFGAPATWDSASGGSKEVLMRVETQSLDYYDRLIGKKEPQGQRKPVASPPVSWLWWTAPALGCAALLVFLFVRPKPSVDAPALPSHGMVEWKNAQAKQKRTRDLTVAQGKQLAISAKRQWDLTARSETQLQITSSSPRVTQIGLRRGRVDVHVVPRSMKRFVVRCRQDYQVVVKGTKFSVEQHQDWLRVEVTRGEVAIERAGREKLRLKKGKGLRIALASGKAKAYDLPPLGQRDLAGRLQWTASRDVAQLYLDALDLGLDPRRVRERRVEILQLSAALMQRHRQFEKAQALWSRLAAVEAQGSAAKTSALFFAAESCKMAHAKALKRCRPLFRRLLEEKHVALYASVILWDAQAMLQQGLREEAKRALTRAIKNPKLKNFHGRLHRFLQQHQLQKSNAPKPRP